MAELSVSWPEDINLISLGEFHGNPAFSWRAVVSVSVPFRYFFRDAVASGYGTSAQEAMDEAAALALLRGEALSLEGKNFVVPEGKGFAVQAKSRSIDLDELGL